MKNKGNETNKKNKVRPEENKIDDMYTDNRNDNYK